MPEIILPNKIQIITKDGFNRIKNYRKARAMFIREFAGQYYSSRKGLTGEEPLNLMFHAISSYVPNLVMENPVTEVTTEYIPQEAYGELLGLAINQVVKKLKLKKTLRAWIVAALFGVGIIKVGIAASGEMLQFGDVNIDPGQIYAKLVDLDDFVIDPSCTNWDEAAFIGSRIRVPRQVLLDDNSYNSDLVMQLPRSRYNRNEKVEDITKQVSGQHEMYSLQDYVDVVELWIPEANALVTISDPEQVILKDYLRVTDYYGPSEGPYVRLSFTPPVPKNPLPIAPVSLWYDLHIMANRTFTKIMDQADRQKDILLYNPALADEAQDVIEAKDGDAIASSDPKGAQVYSYGGQNRDNVLMLQELQIWFNYIAHNPDQLIGSMTPATKGGRETATRSQIIQSNISVGLEDARSILYDQTSEISRRIGWYLHTDPLINLPLIKRSEDGKRVQLTLTPEQRTGDFLRFIFNIRAQSMSRLDPIVRSKRVLEFATNLLPALMNSAILGLRMGIPFNVQRAITDLAKEFGITEVVQDWFNDPEFQQKMAIMMALGPQNAGKAAGSQVSMAGVMQNSGFPMARNIPSQQAEMNQQAQLTAAEGQSANQGVY